MQTYVLTSNDAGDTWAAPSVLAASPDPIELLRATETGPFFILVGSGSHRVARTTDGGDVELFTDPKSGLTPISLAYEFRSDTLYIEYSDGVIYGLIGASQIDASLANAAVVKAIADGTIDIMAATGGIVCWRRYPDFPSGVSPQGTRSIVSGKR